MPPCAYLAPAIAHGLNKKGIAGPSGEKVGAHQRSKGNSGGVAPASSTTSCTSANSSGTVSTYIKDPDTGRRRSRMNGEARVVTLEVPDSPDRGRRALAGRDVAP